jgi:GMP synthase (glutamine-hydrolysing)
MSQIVIIDAGGQYCHLLARRVREAGVRPEICAPQQALERGARARGFIVSGGPDSVYAADAVRCPGLFDAGRPVLGICYGHQLMAHALGGVVEPGTRREYGEARLHVAIGASLLAGIGADEPVWMSHGDEVKAPPAGFVTLARTESCPIAVMADGRRALFGLQFHPEVAHTPCGARILRNFLFDVCGCVRDLDLSGQVARLEREIREQVGERSVLFFVSGGVDSTVAFTLCTEALGPQRVRGVFVDTGFMRKDECRRIEAEFGRRGWHNIQAIDASARFLDAVRDVADPERKRRIIGQCFLDVQRQVEEQHELESGRWMLGQGTIYPDTIESGGGPNAALIKTHHNRVPGIERLIERGLLLEPMRALYKDEVRDIGRQLDLPEALVGRHPFPGPGLAVRCLCSVDERRLERPEALTRSAAELGLTAWSVPLRTVGVQGDARSYHDLVLLGPGAELSTYERAAEEITRAVAGTNRVTFLVAPDDARGLERAWVRGGAFLTRERLDLLREADALAHELLEQEGLGAEVWQFPVVALPLSLRGGETIGLRPVSSSDAMTARCARLPPEFVKRLGARLAALAGVDAVLFDVTHKPPATIEWE